MTVWGEYSDSSVVSGAHWAGSESTRSTDLSICVKSFAILGTLKRRSDQEANTALIRLETIVEAKTESSVTHCHSMS